MPLSSMSALRAAAVSLIDRNRNGFAASALSVVTIWFRIATTSAGAATSFVGSAGRRCPLLRPAITGTFSRRPAMRTITKKLIRDERGILVDPEAAFRFTPAPVPEVPREVLAELLQPGMIPATGSFEPRYAP